MPDAPLRLYLLRHGESAANAAGVFSGRGIDAPLTPRGQAQARRQAESLLGVPFQALYCSPMRRARQTAAIVGEALGLQAQVSEALLEVDIGGLDGQSLNDAAHWQTFEEVLFRWQHLDLAAGFEGGETLADVQRRLSALLDKVSRTGGPALLVGHQLVFAVALWLWCQAPGPSLTACRMNRGHLSMIEGWPGQPFRLVQFNQAAFDARAT